MIGVAGEVFGGASAKKNEKFDIKQEKFNLLSKNIKENSEKINKKDMYSKGTINYPALLSKKDIIYGIPKSYSSIDENEFARFALKNPAILYAAYRLREALILRIGGAKLFFEYTSRRLAATKLAPSTLKSAKDIINLVPSSIESIRQRSNVRSTEIQLYPQDLIPLTTNRLAGTLTLKGHERFSEDFAPEADLVYAKLIYTDIFGKIIEMRRRGNEGLQSVGSSRSVLKSQASVKRIQGTSGNKSSPPITPANSQKALPSPLPKQASRKVMPS
jgi:hypothetical protein